MRFLLKYTVTSLRVETLFIYYIISSYALTNKFLNQSPFFIKGVILMKESSILRILENCSRYPTDKIITLFLYSTKHYVIYVCYRTQQKRKSPFVFSYWLNRISKWPPYTFSCWLGCVRRLLLQIYSCFHLWCTPFQLKPALTWKVVI